MAEQGQNPWSFTSADVLTATIAASPTGLISSAGGIVNLTTTGAHGLSTTVQQWVTIINPTLAAYKGFYKVLSVPSTTTAILYSENFRYNQTILAASGGGTMILNQWNQNIRAEDMSWLNGTATNEIIVLTKDGNVIWDAIAPTTGTYSRSKPFWIAGLSIQALPSGTLTITIN
jgi:hypothetical protein